ncbi:MAG: hypothetical protein KDD45_12485 [Bdellovibrionales bacterium]|nr:hypothetical protein [Bdellovibrionales bacterium]
MAKRKFTSADKLAIFKEASSKTRDAENIVNFRYIYLINVFKYLTTIIRP